MSSRCYKQRVRPDSSQRLPNQQVAADSRNELAQTASEIAAERPHQTQDGRAPNSCCFWRHFACFGLGVRDLRASETSFVSQLYRLLIRHLVSRDWTWRAREQCGQRTHCKEMAQHANYERGTLLRQRTEILLGPVQEMEPEYGSSNWQQTKCADWSFF